MNRSKPYNTKQGQTVCSFLVTSGGRQVAADEIAEYADASGTHIAYATIYRHLDRLVQQGVVRKLVMNGVDRAYYQYVGENNIDCLQMKCNVCGKLISLNCTEANEFENHILDSHNFKIDPSKTVFYGRCGGCKE